SVKDTPDQQARVDAMADRAEQFARWMDENVRLMRDRRRLEVETRIQHIQGNRDMKRLRELTDDFLEREERLDLQRHEVLDEATRRQNWVLLGGGILAVASATGLLFGFSRGIARRLAVLVDNSRRMAEGKELAAPL